MLKTKCDCGARYEYEEAEAGQTVTCECGKSVSFPAPPPAAPHWFCGKCAAKIPEGAGRQWHGLGVCKKCFARLEKDEEERQIQINKMSQQLTAESAVRVPANLALKVPSYLGLAIVATFLRACGIAGIAICAVGLLLVVTRLLFQTNTELASNLALITYLLDCGVAGLFLLAAGEALGCLRDIAVNSFRR